MLTLNNTLNIHATTVCRFFLIYCYRLKRNNRCIIVFFHVKRKKLIK